MPKKHNFSRINILALVYVGAFFGVVARLFFWQVVAKDSLAFMADVQHQSENQIPAARGQILTSDGFPLVHNQPSYTLFAYKSDLDLDTKDIARKIAPFIALHERRESTAAAAMHPLEYEKLVESSISAKLDNQDRNWIPLKRNILEDTKASIELLDINGIGFDEYQIRSYPESSMAGQLVGFVGSDQTGKPKGYFGIEGYYDIELQGKSGLVFEEKDALGRPIPIGDFDKIESVPGHTLITHIHRGLQYLVETELKEAIEKFEAKSGEVIIMDPKTGAVMAIASLPSYDPHTYKIYPQEHYKIPSIADSYEPGSTFKTIVMAAGIDAGVVTPSTTCDSTCDGPVNISGYTIKTWNDEYNKGLTMTEVLEKSDNTGMIFVARKLGTESFLDYIHAFGFGQETGIDLESETVPKLREKWGQIDLATGSFGQGIAVTSIQMLSAVSAIANQGERMQPAVVKSIITNKGTQDLDPVSLGRVISPKAADMMVAMMVRSAQHGEAQWAVPKGYQIAGKTGTAQIPIAGHYDEDKTIASFVGFAPASDPAFVMLVKLTEPKSSPWASETAAPLWFDLAKKIFPLLNIPVG